ncbi:MAG: hypothetical protein Q4D19_06610 [Lautropia sp.]|nr:hypothetical protein [Lautropia sp.]
MMKRALFVSSLLVSSALMAAEPAEVVAPSKPVAAEKASADAKASTDSAARVQDAAQKASGSQAAGTDSAERKALLAERIDRQRELNILKAQRDSELSRLSLNRLAASRGGDPDFSEKKNQQMLKHMRERDAHYKARMAEAQTRVKAVDQKIAELDAREKAAGGTASGTGNKPAAQ